MVGGGQTSVSINTLQIFPLLFDKIGIAMRQKPLLKVSIFRYSLHILFITIGHCIDAKSFFKKLEYQM